VVLDKPLLEELGLDENSEVEVPTNLQIIVITRNALPSASADFATQPQDQSQIRRFFKPLSE
jgi:hypothetical protein